MKKIFIVTEGQSETNFVNRAYKKVEFIERKILEEEGYDGKLFFPYIELHEFEAMLFSDVTKLEETYFEYDLTALKECVKLQSNPELINNGPETAPSKRIINCINCFDKANTGVDVLEKIGIENISEKCRHFAEWMKCIEARI